MTDTLAAPPPSATQWARTANDVNGITVFTINSVAGGIFDPVKWVEWLEGISKVKSKYKSCSVTYLQSSSSVSNGAIVTLTAIIEI